MLEKIAVLSILAAVVIVIAGFIKINLSEW